MFTATPRKHCEIYLENLRFIAADFPAHSCTKTALSPVKHPLKSSISAFSNVVGYQDNVTTNGNQGAGASFFKIGGTMTMGDVHVKGYSGDEYSNTKIFCRQLKSNGKDVVRMFWWDEREDPSEEITEKYGWYDIYGEACYNGNELPTGVGLWYTVNEKGNYSLESNGQVLTETYNQVITNGNQLVANPTPIALTMGQIHVIGYSGDEYSNTKIFCRQLKSNGKDVVRMFWWDEREDPSEEITEKYGWYDGYGEECYNGNTLAAGAALWFTLNEKGSYQIVWPSSIEE